MRLAAGERLWKDVGYYYGPLAPYAVAGAFRAFGSKVSDVRRRSASSPRLGTLAALLLAGRRFLTPSRAPASRRSPSVSSPSPRRTGRSSRPYAMAALLAVGLTWGAFLLASSGRAGLGGRSRARSPSSRSPKPRRRSSARPSRRARGAPGVAPPRDRGRPGGDGLRRRDGGNPRSPTSSPTARFATSRCLPSSASSTSASRGSTRRSSRAASRGLLGGRRGPRGVGAPGDGARGPTRRLAVAGGALLAAGLLGNALALREPVVTTGVRGLPLLLAASGARRAPWTSAAATSRRRLPLAAALLGLAFAWRTALWTVPAYPYAPLAAVSALPAVAWLLGARIPRAAGEAVEAARGRSSPSLRSSSRRSSSCRVSSSSTARLGRRSRARRDAGSRPARRASSSRSSRRTCGGPG